MAIKYHAVKGRYVDSVLLMQITRELESHTGVSKAGVMTGSKENLEIFRNLGFSPPTDIKSTDVLIAIEAESDEAAQKAVNDAIELMDKRTSETKAPELTLDELQDEVKTNDLPVLFVSTPGQYVREIASRALDRGLHVHIFSSNVPVEDEVALKTKGREKRLLVMGPDAGTVILNGKGLGFANAVRTGKIGVVGSSGTGIQELTVLLDKGGAGISAAIGTGSKDISSQVGGTMTKMALELLSDSQFLIVIGKKPDEKVKRKIIDMMKSKPSAFVALGESKSYTDGKTLVTGFIDDAANFALKTCGMKPFAWTEEKASRPGGSRRLLRGFFVGGSLCYQAQAILVKQGVNVYSNGPLDEKHLIPKDWRDLDVCIDTGAEEYVQGKPHPMIDPKARNSMIVDESKRQDVAVILFDVVLGYGSAQDVLAGLESVAKGPVLVASICGTTKDKQDFMKVKEGLERLGVKVLDSSGRAAEYASRLAG